MKLSALKNEWLQMLILIIPFCAVALLWDKLPDWVPTHWNARGEVDDYTRKRFGTMLVPVINVVIAFFVGVLPWIDPKLKKYDAEIRTSLWRTVKVCRLSITGFLSFISLAMLAAALGLFKSGDQFNSVVLAGAGLLFIVLGNVMTKLRPNYFIGIRTPWTLESKEVWTKTHRAGGRLMVATGILMLALFPVVSLERYIYWVVLPAVLGSSLFSILYSYVIYRKERSSDSARPPFSTI